MGQAGPPQAASGCGALGDGCVGSVRCSVHGRFLPGKLSSAPPPSRLAWQVFPVVGRKGNCLPAQTAVLLSAHPRRLRALPLVCPETPSFAATGHPAALSLSEGWRPGRMWSWSSSSTSIVGRCPMPWRCCARSFEACASRAAGRGLPDVAPRTENHAPASACGPCCRVLRDIQKPCCSVQRRLCLLTTRPNKCRASAA